MKPLLRQAEHWQLMGIGLLALLTRLAFAMLIFPQISGPLNLGSDPDYFGQLAQNWAYGHGYVFHPGDPPSTFRGPGYPAVLVVLYWLAGSPFPAIAVLQSLMGAATCMVVYAIGRRVGGRQVGMVAGLLSAAYPLAIWYTPRLQYEPLFTLLLSIGVLWLLKLSQGGRLQDAVLAGLWFGVASLVNQVVILLPPVLLAALFLFGRLRSNLVARSGLLLTVMFAVVLPWTVRNYWVSGRLIPVHSGGITQFVKGNYEFEHYDEAPLQTVALARIAESYMARLLILDGEFDVRDEGWDQLLLPHAIAYLRQHPQALLAKIAGQLPRFWYLSETPLKSKALAIMQLPLLVLAALGTTFSTPVRHHHSGVRAVLVLPVVYFNLVYAATHVEARYSAPVIPLVLVMATLGLGVIKNQVVCWRSSLASERSRIFPVSPEQR